MDFSLEDDQRELLAVIDRIGEKELRPSTLERRDSKEAPNDVMHTLAQAGLLGLSLPVEYGGGGRPELDSILAIERISYYCPESGAYSLMSIAGPPSFIAKWGNDEQKKRFLPGACEGQLKFAISLTEPEAGSALTDLRTSATANPDGSYTINGSKIYCSYAADADYILVFVRFFDGAAGIGAVIVDRHADGLVLGPRREHIHGAPWHELFFNSLQVDEADILFDGNAFSKLISSYSLERCAAASHVIGIAQWALDMSVEYAESRHQFGRPISDFQMIQAKLADMYISLETARLLLWKTVCTGEDGIPDKRDASAARVYAAEAAVRVTDDAMQIHGGYGMSTEAPLEWLYRCVRPHMVAGGTQEIHRSMIAADLIGRRISHRR